MTQMLITRNYDVFFVVVVINWNLKPFSKRTKKKETIKCVIVLTNLLYTPITLKTHKRSKKKKGTLHQDNV